MYFTKKKRIILTYWTSIKNSFKLSNLSDANVFELQAGIIYTYMIIIYFGTHASVNLQN